MSEDARDGPFHSKTHTFDPIQYIKDYYSGSYPCVYDQELFELLCNKIHKLFADGKYRGIYLLDVGSGPVIIPIITASEWFDEIYLSDLSKDNIDFLRKWKDGETEATKAMEYQMSVFTLLDRKDALWREQNDKIRAKVKDVIHFDMHKPEMLKGTAIDGVEFDLVTSCQSMCAASSTFDGYVEVIKNISGLLKPGGHLVILDTMDQTTYTAGDKKFGLLCVTEDEIKTAFLQNGFEIEQFEINKLVNYPHTVLSVAETVYCVVGRKL